MSAVDWTPILVPVSVGLTFALCRRLFPARLDKEDVAPLTDEERRNFHRWQVGGLLPFFIFTALLGFAWYLALEEAAGWVQRVQRMTPDTRFFVRPSEAYWALAALFLGIISSIPPIDWLYRCLQRDRYLRYERACEERLGFDGRVVVWMAALVAVGASLWFVAGVRTFARFDAAGVEIGRPLALRSEFYRYTRVKAIEHRATFVAPNGNVFNRPYHVILFDDGTSWNTNGGLRDPIPELDERIVLMVSCESGKPIQERP